MITPIHGYGVTRGGRHRLVPDGLANSVHVGCSGLLYRLCPEVNSKVGCLHGVVGDPALSPRKALFLNVLFPLFDEFGVFRCVDGHEIIPRCKVAHQRLCIDPSKFFFTNRKGYHRDVFGPDALIPQLFVEWPIGVAVDRGDDRGGLA